MDEKLQAEAMTPRSVEQRILFVRGQRVILDSVLAELYEVEVRVLNQAVRRNIERFPDDFVIHLEQQEVEILRSQFVILRAEHGRHSKYPPLAFTEQGVAMLSGVLRSKRAVMVNIEIMRTLRERRNYPLPDPPPR